MMFKGFLDRFSIVKLYFTQRFKFIDLSTFNGFHICLFGRVNRCSGTIEIKVWLVEIWTHKFFQISSISTFFAKIWNCLISFYFPILKLIFNIIYFWNKFNFLLRREMSLCPNIFHNIIIFPLFKCWFWKCEKRFSFICWI